MKEGNTSACATSYDYSTLVRAKAGEAGPGVEQDPITNRYTCQQYGFSIDNFAGYKYGAGIYQKQV